MAFDGSEGAPIDLTDAAQWTKKFRTQNPDSIKAHYFGRKIIEKILDQSECVGIRIFQAIDEHGTQHLILAGTDANENNQLNGLLGEASIPCPNQCGNADALNS